MARARVSRELGNPTSQRRSDPGRPRATTVGRLAVPAARVAR
ncbi:hypothetical protein [Halorussus pelagicus]|nr:hypothetical protein [Halorussus pelagicus]